MLHVEWYHICWPRLTAKRVEPVVSMSWASCCYCAVMCSALRYSGMLLFIQRSTCNWQNVHWRWLRRGNWKLCRVCPGTHQWTGANITFAPVHFRAYLDFWSESAIVTFIAFTKCSLFISHFKMLDDGTILYLSNCVYTYRLRTLLQPMRVQCLRLSERFFIQTMLYVLC